jgi:hypothetical protein
MGNVKLNIEKRLRDPYVDRRAGEDRRWLYDTGYFENGGTERRKGAERRWPDERREDFVRVSQWVSIFPGK